MANADAIEGPKYQISPGSSPWLQRHSQSNDGTLFPNGVAKERASCTSSTRSYNTLITIPADIPQSMNRIQPQNSARDFRFGENGPRRRTAAIQTSGRARQTKLIHSNHGWRAPPLPAEKAASAVSDPMPIPTSPTLLQETTGCSRKARARAERKSRARAAHRLFFRSCIEASPDAAFAQRSCSARGRMTAEAPSAPATCAEYYPEFWLTNHCL